MGSIFTPVMHYLREFNKQRVGFASRIEQVATLAEARRMIPLASKEYL